MHASESEKKVFMKTQRGSARSTMVREYAVRCAS
jgi:hypothetical protein